VCTLDLEYNIHGLADLMKLGNIHTHGNIYTHRLADLVKHENTLGMVTHAQAVDTRLLFLLLRSQGMRLAIHGTHLAVQAMATTKCRVCGYGHNLRVVTPQTRSSHTPPVEAFVTGIKNLD